MIPPHCTIAPVLGQFKLDPPNSAQLVHHPLFHAANRFQLRNGRPVLASYVARLPVYPARFRPEADPHRLLFGWQPYQRDTRVYSVDIPGFETAAGVTVDYVLLWDIPAAEKAGPYAALRATMAAAGYVPFYRSSGGRMEAYRRPGPGSCGAAPATAVADPPAGAAP